MPKILVTGFGAFGGVTDNPSAIITQALIKDPLPNTRVVGGVLPVEFAAAGERLQELLARHEPDLAVCLGVAPSRNVISLERIAVNLVDARIPDNGGQQPVDECIARDAPTAYFSTLPIKAMKQAMEREKAPVEISNSAGTFVCNMVFFTLMHALRERPQTRGGFMHVPPVRPGLSASALIHALRSGLAAALAHPQDVRVSAGRED